MSLETINPLALWYAKKLGEAVALIRQVGWENGEVQLAEWCTNLELEEKEILNESWRLFSGNQRPKSDETQG